MKRIKRILAFVLAFVFVVSLAAAGAPTEVYAAKTKTYTFVKGEKMSFTDYSNVKSVKSSDSKIVSVKKDEDNSKYFIINAKKKGSATITIKTEYGTKTYKIKVVANDIKVEAKTISTPGYMVYKITNNTDVTFDSLKINYTLKDSDGEELVEDSFKVYDLAAGATAYKEVYYSSYSYSPSAKKSTGKADLESSDRNALSYTYTDRADKLKVTVTDTLEDSTLKLKVKFKSSYTDRLYAVADVLLYDSEDHIIGIKSVSKYLSGKETSTETYNISLYNVQYDHYKVVKRAYSKKIN